MLQGYFVSQNGRGHVLGHVKDLGEDPTKIDKVRIYRTNARYGPLSLTRVVRPSTDASANSSTPTTRTLLACSAWHALLKAESRTLSLHTAFTTSFERKGRTCFRH